MARKKTGIGLAVLLIAGGTAYLGLADRPQEAVFELGNIDQYVFVPSRAAPEVTIIDMESDEVVAVFELAHVPDQMLVSEELPGIVTSNIAAKTVTLTSIWPEIDPIVVTLDVEPRSMVLSTDSWLVAVSDEAAGVVAVISLMQGRQIARIDGLYEPAGMTFSDESSLIYVPDQRANSIKLIDIVQGRVISEMPVNAETVADARGEGGALYEISALTRSANGRYGFCSLRYADGLAILDLNAQNEITVLELGGEPSRPYGTADGRYMLVANEADRTVSIIDTGMFEVAATLPGAADVSAINTGWFETVAFVISASENRAVVIDLETLETVGEIALPTAPGPGVVTEDAEKLYVALSGSNQVAVIDTQARQLAMIIEDVGHEPWGLTTARTNNYCH